MVIDLIISLFNDVLGMYGPVVSGILSGFSRTLSFPNIVFAIMGTLIGMLFGAIPGLGGMVAVTLVLTFAFGLSPESAIILLMATTGGTTQSATITSILLNTPGQFSSAISMIDGHKLAEQGRAIEALTVAALSSGLGAIFGLAAFSILLPFAVLIVLSFGPFEIFLVVLMGLIVIASISPSFTKGLIAGFFGISLGLVGLSPISATPRFTFGQASFYTGLDPVPVLIGLFIVSELVTLSAREYRISSEGMHYQGFLVGLREGISDVVNEWKLFIRSAIIGNVVGMIPGAGATVASAIAYSFAEQTEKNSETFGTGDVRGVLAPEAANDAREGGALLPTVALGLPGSGVMIILLIAFIIFGITPGPNVVQNHLGLVYTIVSALLFSNILSSTLVLAGLPLFELVTKINTRYLVPPILLASFVGAFALDKDAHVYIIVIAFAILGFFMKRADYSIISFLLGLILAPIVETQLLMAVEISGGNLTYFISPLSIILFIIVLLVLWNEVR